MKNLYSMMFLFLILMGLLGGCSNEIKTTELNLPIGKYVLQESEQIMKPVVSLEDSNKFSFSYSMLSSYFNYGSYTEEDGNLILKTDDGMFKYVFKVKGNTLIFNSKESSEKEGPLHTNVLDGSVFTFNNDKSN